ncbi:MAG: rane-bound hydrogenase subunit beta [Thermoproteota archaeon]|nr:rane-bound hydrogenase subunit beta [Thermoproteota archaeon]
MSMPLTRVKESLTGMVRTIEEVAPQRININAEPRDVKSIFRKLLEDFKNDFYLDFVAAVDYVEDKQFEVNYVVWVYSLKTILSIRFRLPKENPNLDTISDLIPSAINHEKEAYDLMGITFSGNSELKRGFFVAEGINEFPLVKNEVKKA